MPSSSQPRTSILTALCAVFGALALIAYAVSKFAGGRLIILFVVSAGLAFAAAFILLTRRLRRPLPVIGRLLLALAAALIIAYVILFPLIYFSQDVVANGTSAFFQPHKMTEEAAQAIVMAGIEPLEITAPDGIRLRGWLVKNGPSERAPLLIFFDGSGSAVSDAIPYMRQLDGWSVALVNYRGFGRSEGAPSHQAVLADAITVYDALVRRPDVDAERVVAMGYSLGTGVAVHLAAQRAVAGTVLASPFDAWQLAGPNPSLLFKPLAPIMKPYFDSMARAASITSPLLCLIGDADTVISPERSRRLAGQWGGPATIRTYEGENHDMIWRSAEVWGDIQAFLDEIG